MVRKDKDGNLPQWYQSAYEVERLKELHPEWFTTGGDLGKVYRKTLSFYVLKYCFEGDDSILALTQHMTEAYEAWIMKEWESLGFRMKLQHGNKKKYATFTGFDFLVDDKGMKPVFVPEIMRNLASSSWSTSRELIADVTKRHRIGAQAQLARAINFADCGPLATYFARLALSHCNAMAKDVDINEEEAHRLGIGLVDSVVNEAVNISANATCCDDDMLSLIQLSTGVKLDRERELELLQFAPDRWNDTSAAIRAVPRGFWGPLLGQARR